MREKRERGDRPLAAGELGVGALGPAVSHLHGPEELLLELVGFLLVKLVIGLSRDASATAISSIASARPSSSCCLASALVYAIGS